MKLLDGSIDIDLREDKDILDITFFFPDDETSLTQGFTKSEVKALAYYLLGISQAMNHEIED